jgi:hypothetical protein
MDKKIVYLGENKQDLKVKTRSLKLTKQGLELFL